MANRCNELSRREIRAKSHRNDIFGRLAFSDKNEALIRRRRMADAIEPHRLR
jgi:hypothetical protein